MILLRDVRKSVLLPGGGRLDILRGLNLEVGTGEAVAIVGRSGSGKTTLLNVLGLLDRADSGTYDLQGKAVSDIDDRARARLRGEWFGFIFQSFMLFPRHDAVANVAAPLYHASRPLYRQRQARAAALLESVGLQGRQRSLPRQLSGGEQQRVAIARSLSRDPMCLLADEPTGSLDLDTAADILDLLFGIVHSRGRSLILVTHDQEVASRANRVLELRDVVLVAG